MYVTNRSISPLISACRMSSVFSALYVSIGPEHCQYNRFAAHCICRKLHAQQKCRYQC